MNENTKAKKHPFLFIKYYIDVYFWCSIIVKFNTLIYFKLLFHKKY